MEIPRSGINLDKRASNSLGCGAARSQEVLPIELIENIMNARAEAVLSQQSTENPGINPGGLAGRTYEDLRGLGLTELQIMAFATELLSLVATGVRDQKTDS